MKKRLVMISGALTFTSALFGQLLFLGPPIPVAQATKKTQVITFADPNNVALPASTFLVSASATSGLAVSVTSATTSACTVNGSAVTLIGPGKCSLVASQSGNGTYAAASPVTRSFTVTVSPGAQLCGRGINGPGGYFDPSRSVCDAGAVVPFGDLFCRSGNGQGSIYSPVNSECVDGVVVPFGGAYCGPGVNGPGTVYNPFTEYCASGAAVPNGDLYCTRGARGPGGIYVPSRDYCNAGSIQPWIP
jgi:hypothetical protein